MIIFASGYPYRHYIFYTVQEAMRLYRREFGLKGKHNVKFYRSFGGVDIRPLN